MALSDWAALVQQPQHKTWLQEQGTAEEAAAAIVEVSRKNALNETWQSPFAAKRAELEAELRAKSWLRKVLPKQASTGGGKLDDATVLVAVAV